MLTFTCRIKPPFTLEIGLPTIGRDFESKISKGGLPVYNVAGGSVKDLMWVASSDVPILYRPVRDGLFLPRILRLTALLKRNARIHKIIFSTSKTYIFLCGSRFSLSLNIALTTAIPLRGSFSCSSVSSGMMVISKSDFPPQKLHLKRRFKKITYLR